MLAQLPEQSEAAHWEIKVHQSLEHHNIMPLVDHTVVPAANGAEEFLLLMPLYPNGTLLDLCIKHMEAGTRIPEMQCLCIFQKILKGVCAFHEHTPPWAHRDIKPANVLLGEECGSGPEPVLMDFGSVTTARRTITSRTEALLLQEDAAQNCSMPYRAPELFDVPSDCALGAPTRGGSSHRAGGRTHYTHYTHRGVASVAHG